MDPRDGNRRLWPLYPLQLVELVARDVAKELAASGNSQKKDGAQDHASSLKMALEQARLLDDMGIMPEIDGNLAAFRRPGRFYQGSTWVPRIPGALAENTDPDMARRSREVARRERRRSRAYAQKMRALAIAKKPHHAREFKMNGVGQAGEDSQAGDGSRDSLEGLARSSDPKTSVQSHNKPKRQRTASKQLPSALNYPFGPAHTFTLIEYNHWLNRQSLSRADSILHPSRVPLSITPQRPSVVFQSQILPPSFSQEKRFQISQIFLHDAPYIPTCVVMAPGRRTRSFYGNLWDNSDLLSSRALKKHDPLPKQHQPAKAMNLPTVLRRWPQGRIPTEIYRRITEYLPRDSIENMRLVCKEFEVNVSAVLFHSVVVPFRPEIYGMISASRLAGIKDIEGKGKAKVADGADPAIGDAPFGLYDQELKIGAVHKGMAVFRGWGPRIRKFAMVFEVDGDSLEHPPLKDSLETVVSFWGSYQWPRPQYNRYELCAGLERTADETDYMTDALSNLSEVTELGLAVDSGLGWLAGPDISDRAKIFDGGFKVFGPQHLLPDAAARERTSKWDELSTMANKPFLIYLLRRCNDIAARANKTLPEFYKTVKANLMVRVVDDMRLMGSIELAWHMRSGFGELLDRLGVLESELPERWSAALHTPAYEIQSEAHWVAQARVVGQALEAIEECLQTSENEDYVDEDSVMLDEEDTAAEASSSAVQAPGVGPEEVTVEAAGWQGPEEFRPIFIQRPLIFGGKNFSNSPNTISSGACAGTNPFLSEALIPNNLATAQKEWLLETEWAQRAFLLSYTLAVVDNISTFQNVRTFTVAKLSSRYLPQLQRADFWAALPNLDTVTIIVSPDWRNIIQEHAGYIYDPAINPSEASGALYRLVQGCIAPLQKVKTLTLGFVGGGEHATGIFARNKHVVPGPITENPKDQLEATKPLETLHLPHVEHLTFTNCWFGPHALRSFVTEMRQANLHTLRLDSVSLAATPSIPAAHPVVPANPPQAAAANVLNLPVILQLGPGGPTTPAPVTTTWLTTNPRPDSWPELIDHITPAFPIATLRAVHNPSLETPVPRSNGTLHRLVFTSCGYVRFQASGDFAIHLGSPPARDRNPRLMRRAQDLELVMMTTTDWLLGRIHPIFPQEERECLQGAFGLRTGWGWGQEDGRKSESRFDPLEDDEWMAGMGRFSGEVAKVE